MALKEEYGEMELDEYEVDSQNPNPKGENNQDWVGESPKSVDSVQVIVEDKKPIVTQEV